MHALLWNHHALYDYDDRIPGGHPWLNLYALFKENPHTRVMDRMLPYWWMPILWVALIAIFILILWLARRSLVKETLFLLEHAKDEIAAPI